MNKAQNLATSPTPGKCFLENVFGKCFWKRFLENVFGKCFWKMFLENVFGKCFWKMFLEHVFGTCFWKMFSENVFGKCFRFFDFSFFFSETVKVKSCGGGMYGHLD
jgi:hypothetical protein